MANNMQSYFSDIVKGISSHIKPQEKFTAWFSGEEMDFARFSHNKIRQAGSVTQRFVSLDLIDGKKHAGATIGLSGSLATDAPVVQTTINKLRDQLAVSAEDPYFIFNEQRCDSASSSPNELAPKEEVVGNVLKNATGLDHVGIYFGGPIFKGFANSLGQFNWFEKSSFVLDTSVYHSNDKAIKQSYSGTRFDNALHQQKIAKVRSELKLFDKPIESLKPGLHRVYFSPAAVYEILSLLNWQGFSRKMLEVKNSPLVPLSDNKKTFSPSFSLSENVALGVGPNFQGQGFIKPANLEVIAAGRLKNAMVSPATAAEYGLTHTGSDEGELLTAMQMAPGDLPTADVLKTLGNGLYINNLWYLNYSDPTQGCLTGMTRFLCYTVKNGEPQAAFNVMRFDESIYNILGSHLAAITSEREQIIDNGTYEERSTSSAILPGIIVDDFRFTL